MKIGELAQAAHTPVETIRFYEREGLLQPPQRTASNYRIYGDEHVLRLVFIRRCRTLDMALDEIRALLGFRDDPAAHCDDVNAVLDDHIGHVQSRIHELQALERQLQELRASCHAQPGDACGILHALNQNSSPLDGAAASAAGSGHTQAGAVLARSLGLVERFIGAFQRLLQRLAAAVARDAG
jgi:Cd(II)/Pb(II)-responsive transcriptional regulator